MKFAFIVLPLVIVFAGCQSLTEKIRARVDINGIASTPENRVALQSFFHALEKTWDTMITQSKDIKSEKSEISLVLIPAGNGKLEIKEIIASSSNLSRQAGDAAVFSIEKTLSEFHFPEEVYREFVKMKEVTIHFKYEKPENGA